MKNQNGSTAKHPFALRPASREEAGLFYSDEEQDDVLGTVGHVRMDFGSGGKQFWSTWWPHNGDQLNTPEFKEELQMIVDALRQDGPLQSLSAMNSYCWHHGGEISKNDRIYGYIAETAHYRFCLRCTPRPGEYQGYLYCYDLRQQRMQQQDHLVGRVTYASGEQQEFTDPQEYLRTIREELPYNEELLYKLFGVNAEILIDHAWGWEPCTIADAKSYKPENKSIVSGQVLQCPYDFQKARLVVREMADALALDLVDKGLVTNQLVLTVGYDIENLTDPQRSRNYRGPVTTDRYGRKIPKHAVGTENFPYTSLTSDLLRAVTTLYDRIVDPNLLVRRLSISANKLLDEASVPKGEETEQLDLFTDYAAKERQEQVDEAAHAKERKIQEAMLGIKKRYGKNAILKGMNLEEGATARERNRTIGGHHE